MYKRRTYKRPKRTTRRKYTRKMKIPRAVVRTNLTSIKRRYYVGAWAATVATGWNSTNYSFRLNNIPSYTEFTALFEQYKINAVKLTFIPQWEGGLDQNNAYIAAATVPYVQTPRMYVLIDKDGDPQISTENLMLENSDTRVITNPHKAFSVYVRKPCAQYEVSTSLGFSAASPKPSPWLDCDNYGVNHYGVGIGCQLDGSVTASMYYRVVATYYMQFKGAK